MSVLDLNASSANSGTIDVGRHSITISHLLTNSVKSTLGTLKSDFASGSEMQSRTQFPMPSLLVIALASALPIAPTPAIPIFFIIWLDPLNLGIHCQLIQFFHYCLSCCKSALIVPLV